MGQAAQNWKTRGADIGPLVADSSWTVNHRPRGESFGDYWMPWAMVNLGCSASRWSPGWLPVDCNPAKRDLLFIGLLYHVRSKEAHA